MKLDGIETAEAMQKKHNIPVIYITANIDDAHFNRAKQTHPFGFIAKPFKKLDLQRAIELAISQLVSKSSELKTPTEDNAQPFILSDSIFVRHHNTMVKVNIQDILYIEAERNYCRIYSKTKEYLLVMTLKDMDEKLPAKHFLRVHRSFIVNLSQINEISTSHIVIQKKAIPISKSLKDELLNRIQRI